VLSLESKGEGERWMMAVFYIIGAKLYADVVIGVDLGGGGTRGDPQ